jgi:hypothetical protein
MTFRANRLYEMKKKFGSLAQEGGDTYIGKACAPAEGEVRPGV